jgi:hypothetical protein
MEKTAVCLIACSASKAEVPCAARLLYTGDLFRKSLQWAEACACFDSIMVLSAKHGLVDVDRVIEPYDTSLQTFDASERRRWASSVAKALLLRWPAGTVELVALAGRHYTEELALHLQLSAPRVLFSRPLAGMGIGQQKAWLKRALDAVQRAGVESS